MDLHCDSGVRSGVFPHFPTFHFLRSYNCVVTPETSDFVPKRLYPPRITPDCPLPSPNSEDSDKFRQLPQYELGSALFRYPHPASAVQSDFISRTPILLPPPLLNPNLRKHRGEKKPIPEEQKDDKYFERRRRNNQAAKKSRDARKLREDQIALKATILEHENAILRAQVLTLREETSSLRLLLMEKKPADLSPRTIPLCRS